MATADILRFATAGSVDDGKSSLIGRLLYDSKSILEDQLLAIEHASNQRGTGQLELALLTDGLRAEREQNITIDVAYRYFATDKRKFIIADTPGHLQYTRNMVTGASTADLSVILIDSRKGVLSQSKRHAAISSLLGIQHLVVAVNKMDLVDFSEDVFNEIKAEFNAFTAKLNVPNVAFIPISALLGDNVVDRSGLTPWYKGPTLLSFLESVDVSKTGLEKLRLPIQYVVRPHQDYRGFAGRLESGAIQVGDKVLVAATGLEAVVESILVSGVEADRAVADQAVTISLDREIDVSRGDLFHSVNDRPLVGHRVEAVLCWMHEQPLEVGKRYVLLHANRRVTAIVEQVLHRFDVDNLDPLEAHNLGLNDLGRVVLRTANPLYFDPYTEIPGTGSFVIVDATLHTTVAGGMLQGIAGAEDATSAIVGRAIWLEGFELEAKAIALDLRRFGNPVILLEASTGLDVTQLDEWMQRLTPQGFDVLISGVPAPAGQEVVRRKDLNRTDQAVEAILPLLVKGEFIEIGTNI
jgi:bifunctional enzyme CysN/CysC